MKIESSGSMESMLRIQGTKSAEKKNADVPGNTPESGVKRDRYIPSEKDGNIGLYSMGHDENGDPKINFDSPDKSCNAEDEDSSAGPNEPEAEKSETEECVCNTDKVDRELKRLKEKAERLEQQLRNTADDRKAAVLQKQLAGVRSELAQKDSDSYRRSKAEFS